MLVSHSHTCVLVSQPTRREIIWSGFNHTTCNYMGFYRPISLYIPLCYISGDDTSTADAPTFTNLTDAPFTSFQPCSMEEVRKLLIRSPPKSCSLDPLPTSILREFLDVSLQHGLLPESQKEAIVTPILKNISRVQTGRVKF